MKIVHMLIIVVLVGLAAVSGPQVGHANGSQFIPIDDPRGAKGTSPSGINSQGDIVGHYVDGNFYDPWVPAAPGSLYHYRFPQGQER